MRTLLKIAVVLFIGYLVIDGIVRDNQHPGVTPTTHTTSTPEPNRIGETFATTHSFLAMRSENDAEKAFTLFAAKDDEALKTMALQGRMTLVKSGTTVTLEDRNIFTGVDAFRVRGNPDTSYAVIGQVR
jgi:hypothetical protein